MKRGHIHKYYILISDEDTYLITTTYLVPKLRYRAHAKNVNLSYIAQNLSSVKIVKYLVYSCTMNITTEFNFFA